MKYSAKEIAIAMLMRKAGASYSDIELALNWKTNYHGAKARDMVKATEGKIRVGGRYLEPVLES